MEKQEKKAPEDAKTIEEWGALLSPAEYAMVKHSQKLPKNKVMTEAEWKAAVKAAQGIEIK